MSLSLISFLYRIYCPVESVNVHGLGLHAMVCFAPFTIKTGCIRLIIVISEYVNKHGYEDKKNIVLVKGCFFLEINDHDYNNLDDKNN